MSIKVVEQPSVFFLGRQQADEKEVARFLAAVGAPDWESDAPSPGEYLVELASRNCYQSFNNPRPGGNAAHIGHVLDVGHGSVVEHAVWTIAITGISRSLTHELVRHRIGVSPSQLSQRFVDESACAFVLPPLLAEIDEAGGHEARRRWQEACLDALYQYRTLCSVLADQPEIRSIPDATMRKKRVREAARSVLPNCVETRIVLTGNARAWRWLGALRGSIAADLEIRRLACMLAVRFKDEAPNLFFDVAVFQDADGRSSVRVGHPKV